MHSRTTVIFHCPRRLSQQGTSASAIRPIKMLEALQRKYDVIIVSGNASERKIAWKHALNFRFGGEKPIFCYSEPSTAPLNLSNGKMGMVLHYDLDWRYFAKLKKCGVPIGLYYRDAHWQFPDIFKGNPIGRHLYLYEYRRDLRRISTLCTAVFFPSSRLAARITPYLKLKWNELPAGTEGKKEVQPEYTSGVLKAIYVGGLGGLYDCSGLFSALAHTPQVHALVITRPAEWEKAAKAYGVSANIEKRFLSTESLAKPYSEAQVALLYYEPGVYRDLAMPYKLFEALDYGKPVIVRSNSAAADFVESNGIGWIVRDQADLESLFRRLALDDSELKAKLIAVRRTKESNTWDQRILEVERALLNA